MLLQAQTILISLVFGVSAVLTIGASLHHHRGLVYFFKPLTTALLFLLILPTQALPFNAYTIAILVGLTFSLLGDIFLMLPGSFFRPGLFSFLAAHACYTFAFSTTTPFAVPWAPFAVSALLALALFPQLWKGIPTHTRLPAAAYITLLLIMASQASSRALHLHTLPAASAALGAALFVLSDTLLAWNRFRTPLPAAQALILGTYYPAQWLIVLSVVMVQ